MKIRTLVLVSYVRNEQEWYQQYLMWAYWFTRRARCTTQKILLRLADLRHNDKRIWRFQWKVHFTDACKYFMHPFMFWEFRVLTWWKCKILFFPFGPYMKVFIDPTIVAFHRPIYLCIPMVYIYIYILYSIYLYGPYFLKTRIIILWNYNLKK